MKATRRASTVTATVATLAIVLSACGGGSSDTPASSGSSDGATARNGTLVYGESTEFPENLDPLIASGNSVASANLLIRVLPSAFRVYPDFTVKADMDVLASEPTNEMVDGKQTVTYTLNDKAVWSDGTPMSEADFAFAWNLQKSSDPAAGGCESLISTTGYDQIESVEAGDSDKVAVVTFATPYPDWKGLPTQILPAHILDQGSPEANCTATTAGWATGDGLPEDFSGGPWQITAANVDTGAQTITLTPNPMWWGAGPNLESLTYQSIGSEAGTTVSALQNGEVNLVYPQPQLDLLTQIKDLEPNVTSEVNFGLSFEHMDLNTANVHLANLDVRKAIALALDRQAIVDATVGQFDDRAQVLNNRFYVNNQPEYQDTAPAEYNTQDIAGAKALLEGAGYTMGADGIYANADGPLQLIMSTTVNNPLRESTIDLVTTQLAEAGIGITKSLDPDIFKGTEAPTSLEARGFQIALFAWVSSPFVSGNVSIYKTDGGQNYAGGGSPELDTLLDQLSTETDATAAAGIANQADALVWENMPTIPLYQKPTFIAFSSTYDGVQDNATNAGPVWNSDEYKLKS